MSRTRPPDRLAALVRAATTVFVRAGGVRRAQIDDIARELGVAKGTVYLSVASKEALFDLALRHADRPDAEPPVLPVPTPDPADTLAFVRELAARESRFASLVPGAASDVVLADLYDGLSRNRTALKLVATSAVDWPELGLVWFGQTRRGLVERLAAWIAEGTSTGRFRAVHPAATARLVAETLTWFAVHRHFDPAPDPLPDDIARSTALDALHRTLVP